MANNPLDIYNSFSNSTQIKFLHGSQSGINTMISQGNAIEGAFYLADDTQKLYVGRKDSNNQKVYPVQVSRGVTIVANTSDLPINLNASVTHADAASWAIEEGELYYITDSNILAALRANSSSSTGYEWVQVNPPTGLTGMSYSASAQTYGGREVVESSLDITTQASSTPQSAVQLFTGGNNVTVTDTTITDNTDNNNPITYSAIEISSENTQYAIGANVIANGAALGLSKDNGTALDSNVSLISQSNSINIAYNSDNNAIEFNGPTLHSIGITNDPDNGFEITVIERDGHNQEVSRNVTLQPNISYGKTGSKTTQVFKNGIADLEVYTVEQTDSVIANAIQAQLQTADALSYKGTVNYDEIGPNTATYFSSKTVATGDVYKVALDSNQIVTINNTKLKNGDLIIFNGGDTYPNVIPSALFTNPTAVYNFVDVIPSGDETELSVALGQLPDGGAELTFSNIVRGSANPESIFATDILEGNLISIVANNASGANNITISHKSPGTRVNDNNSLANNIVGEAATFGTDTYKFFALAPNIAEAIRTDNFGHVVGVKGKEIVFKHNRLSSLTTAYINQPEYSSNVSFSIDADDDLGALNKSASINIASNTLKFTSTPSSQFAIDLVWESFDNN